MTNEGSNGGAGGAGGGRRGPDGPDGFGEPDDETVVIVTDEYAKQSLKRLVGVFRGALERGERLAELGDETASEAEADLIVEDIIDHMEEAEMHAAGTGRALTRMLKARRQERARRLVEAIAKTTKEGTT